MKNKSILKLKKQKNHKTRKNIKKIQKGGVLIKMTFPEIIDTIFNSTSELCGYMEHGKYICNDIGPPKVAKVAGSCEQVKAPHIWHTHTSVNKYYPSKKDIEKVLKYNEITKSDIYCRFGCWHMEYKGTWDDSKIKSLDLDVLLERIYHDTNKGFSYNPTAIAELNDYLNTIIHPNFISWEYY